MPSVLVVDDEPQVRELLRRWLELERFDVRTANDAESALTLLADSPPAVIVCDYHMPGHDGLYLAERVRERAPHTAIVIATSETELQPRDTMQRAIVAYVLKPFLRDDFVSAVRYGIAWHERVKKVGQPPVRPLWRDGTPDVEV